MQQSEFNFEIFDTTIKGNTFTPPEIKAVVVLLHGFGEHSGRYTENVIPMLVKAGLAVVSYDNIGHGSSGGKRGHCPSYEALLDILDVIINKGSEQFPELPMFLYGHSMGGNLVLNYVLRRESTIHGIVATSPYLRLAFQPPRWKMIIGKLLLHAVPSITMPSGLDPMGISSVPEEVEKYKADPLVHDKVSPMFSFPIMDAGEWAIANAKDLNINALLVHGTADQIIDYHGTEAFHQNSNKTTLKLFDGGYHELHHDRCNEEMLLTIQNWFRTKIGF